MQNLNNGLKGKIFALILAAAMVFCYIPAAAFADSTTAVAKIGTTTYTSLQAAVDAAENGDTITLLQDASGDGVKIEDGVNKTLTFDFGGHTYTMSGTGVGNGNYKNQAMHFGVGSNITLTNGTLKVTNTNFGIQNYADLTLKDFTVDASGYDGCSFALSCNNGDINIIGNSSLKTTDTHFALNLCLAKQYPDGAHITIDTTGTIGNFLYDVWDDDMDNVPSVNNTSLIIKNGKFTGQFYRKPAELLDEMKKAITVEGGTFTYAVSGNFLKTGYANVKNSDGTYTVTNVAGNQAESATEIEKLEEELKKAQEEAAAASDESDAAQKAYEEQIAALEEQLTEVLTPSKTKNVKLTKGTKKFTATWKKVSNATGYQIQYSTSKKFTKKTTGSK